MGNREAIRPLHYDLEIWKDAMRLAREVYRTSAAFPDSERYGLAAQLRRAAVSVASNIAEGAGRGSRLEYVRYLRIARGSLMEVDTQIWLARDLGYLTDATAAQELIQRRAAKLSALITSKSKEPA